MSPACHEGRGQAGHQPCHTFKLVKRNGTTSFPRPDIGAELPSLEEQEPEWGDTNCVFPCIVYHGEGSPCIHYILVPWGEDGAVYPGTPHKDPQLTKNTLTEIFFTLKLLIFDLELFEKVHSRPEIWLFVKCKWTLKSLRTNWRIHTWNGHSSASRDAVYSVISHKRQESGVL